MDRVTGDLKILHTCLKVRPLLCREDLILGLLDSIEFIKKSIGLSAGLRYYGRSLLTCLFKFKKGLFFGLFLDALALLDPLFSGKAGFFGSLSFFFKLLTALFKLGNYGLKFGALLRYESFCALNNVGAHTEALGDRKGIGTSRHTDEKSVGRG